MRVARHQAYGLRGLTVRLADGEPVRLSGEPVTPPYVKVDRDGVRVESAMGPAGDHLFTYGEHARFHLSQDGSLLLCAPLAGGDEWERGLFGPVLGQVSALAGNVVFAGSATLLADGAVAMVGDTRAVPALAQALERGGHALLSDGAVALSCGLAGVAVHPGASAPDPLDRAPLLAILVLERVAGSSCLMFPLLESIPALMDAWIVPHGRLDRAEQRASGFEQVAATTPAYCLLAGEDTDPARLAETVTSRYSPPSPPPTSSSRSQTSA